MSCRSALNVFRTCSSSFAARGAARPSLNAARRRIAGARSYSAQAQPEQNPAEENKQEGSSGSSAEASNAEKECQEKLKKKEEEVQDLVVRPLASAHLSQCLKCYF